MDTEALEEAKKILQKAADEMGLELISVKMKQDKENGKTLEVFIDKDYAIDLKTIEAYTEKVSPLLDSIHGLDESYMLDISSGGSERLIPYEDIGKLLGHYLDVKLLSSGETKTLKAESLTEDGKVNFVYFLKGRKKKLVLGREDIAEIHMGYKA